jgi:hypothetical protein
VVEAERQQQALVIQELAALEFKIVLMEQTISGLEAVVAQGITLVVVMAEQVAEAAEQLIQQVVVLVLILVQQVVEEVLSPKRIRLAVMLVLTLVAVGVGVLTTPQIIMAVMAAQEL